MHGPSPQGVQTTGAAEHGRADAHAIAVAAAEAVAVAQSPGLGCESGPQDMAAKAAAERFVGDTCYHGHSLQAAAQQEYTGEEFTRDQESVVGDTCFHGHSLQAVTQQDILGEGCVWLRF